MPTLYDLSGKWVKTQKEHLIFRLLATTYFLHPKASQLFPPLRSKEGPKQIKTACKFQLKAKPLKNPLCEEAEACGRQGLQLQSSGLASRLAPGVACCKSQLAQC